MKRPLVPYDGDTLKDIGDIPLGDWWLKCEELLPEDWAMQLVSHPREGFLTYGAVAYLLEELGRDPDAYRQTPWCSTPERALEKLFYALRDGLLSPVVISGADVGEDEGGDGDDESASGEGHPGH